MDLKKLWQLLLGNHKSSTIYGLVLAALYGTIGGQENAVTDTKTLIVSAIILLVGRLIPAEAKTSERLVGNPSAASFLAEVGDTAQPNEYATKLNEQSAEYAKRNAALKEQLASNQAARNEVNNETTDRLDNLRHRPAPDRLRGDL